MSFWSHGFISILLVSFVMSVAEAVLIDCYCKEGPYEVCKVQGLTPVTFDLTRTAVEDKSKVCLRGFQYGLASDESHYVFVWVRRGCGGTFNVTATGPPSWNSWDPWGPCSTTCGGGQRTRTRTCNTGWSSDCTLPYNKDKGHGRCNEEPCEKMAEEVLIDCHYKKGPYALCLVPGMRVATADVTRTVADNDKNFCLKGYRYGFAVDTMSNLYLWVRPGCGGTFKVTSTITPSWESWDPWGACSATCGGGQQSRTRLCNTGDSDDCSTSDNGHSENRICNEEPCVSEAGEESSICGLIPTRFRDRIIGGSDAPSFKYPWMVMLYNVRAYDICGGSIIDENHILTAAHCVVDTRNPKEFVPYKPSDIRVLSGATLMPISTYSSDIDGLKIRRVSKIMQHENYTTAEMKKNDIAILTLKEPITFDKRHVPICLATSQVSPSTDGCKVMGWGVMANGKDAKASSKLQYTNVTILDPSWCDFTFRKYFDEKTHICAGGSGHGPCSGDSGGPLICKASGENRYYQHGVVSSAIKNECGSLPSTYVSVPSFLSWIQSKLTSIEA